MSPIVEFRQYQLHPSHTALYTEATYDSAPLRKTLPLAFFGFPETGAIPLNTAVHLYHFEGGHKQRLEQRAALAKRDEWKDYLGKVKACMIQQSSGIFVEAGIVKDFEQVPGLAAICNDDSISSNGSTKSIIEFRKYKLQLGYDTVHKFLDLYSEALPSKLNAEGTHPTTQLVTVLVSDICSLNAVYEVWKHGEDSVCGMEAQEQSRVASRTANEWRAGIAEIAKLTAVSFESTVLKPAVFSPLS